jgi:hypothetical protein
VNSLTRQIEFDRNVSDLLIRQVPNEVINGFQVDRFEDVIGVSDVQFTSLTLELRRLGGAIKIDSQQGFIFRRALNMVLNELGPDEFQTRTGHAFEEGSAVLKQLDDFLASDAVVNESGEV